MEEAKMENKDLELKILPPITKVVAQVCSTQIPPDKMEYFKARVMGYLEGFGAGMMTKA